MNQKIGRLLSEKDQAARDTLERLRFKAPSVWRSLQDMLRRRGVALSGLGEFSWSDFLDMGTSVAAAKSLSSDERKAANLELEALKEKNKAIEKQIKLELELQESKNRGLTLAQQASMAGESIFDQIKEKPWAIPLLGGLVFALVKSVRGRRGR